MLAIINITYDGQKQFKELSRGDYQTLRTEIPSLQLSEWLEDKEQPYVYVHQECLIDLSTDGMLLAKHGIGFEVKRFKGAYFAEKHSPGDTYNLQVAIPAIGLLTMNEVTHLDDACTDELQRYLDHGWRIIAVCPPNAQRRPDYILGRSKP